MQTFSVNKYILPGDRGLFKANKTTEIQPFSSKMSTTGASTELHDIFDASAAMPLTNNFVNEPTNLRYHRFFDMESQARHEIFVPQGKEQEVLDLDANSEWAKLREFPPFSDAPPPDEMRPNVMGIQQADGTSKYFYIPDEDAKQARAIELMRAKDYISLEEEFELWSKYSESPILAHESCD